MPVIKSAASPEVAEAIQKIEDRADKCYEPLALLDLHPSVAAWALMVRGVGMIEAEIEQRGDNSPELDATFINVSLFTPIVMNWAIRHGNVSAPPGHRRWTVDLAITATQSLDIATRYAHFVTCFPMWHKDRYLADLVSPELVRFTAPGKARNRQVSAHLKSIRPKTGRFQMHRTPKPATMPEINKALFQIAFDGARRTGPFSFSNMRTPRSCGPNSCQNTKPELVESREGATICYSATTRWANSIRFLVHSFRSAQRTNICASPGENLTDIRLSLR